MNNAIERLGATLSDLRRAVRKRVHDRGRHHAARLNRRRLGSVIFIGITGSAGKTTTKTLAAGILSSRGPCQWSHGSGNEHYDVEWTVLKTTRRHEFCVVEAGAPEPGYLDRSLRVLRPHIGVLTLIAREHYSAYRSAEAIAAEKAKLIAALPEDGVAVLNIDDPLVRAIGARHTGRIVWVGRAEGATIRLLESSSRWPQPLTLRVRFEDAEHEVLTRLHGEHLALPVLAALGVALGAGMPFPDALHALSLLEPAQGRMQIERSDDGVVFVRDDWKAPQWSFQAPLEFLRNAHAQRKVAVIGTISDSSKSPSQRYAWAAKQALAVADLVVLVGIGSFGASRSHAGPQERPLHAFASLHDAARFLRTELRAGDLVLLKGTNLQDHLVRLVLDRNRPVSCWDTACGRNEFCGSCPRVHADPSFGLADPGPERDTVPAPAGSGQPVIVGLGNPGTGFRETRHNVGHRVLDALVESAGASWRQVTEGWVSSVLLEGQSVTLLKPGVNINDSGTVIRRFLDKEGGTAADCIVVLDDMDIPLGQVRTKREGGDAGHKGMRSIIAAMGSDAISRIRVGVRRPGDARQAGELVLKQFSADEKAALMTGLKQAEAAIREMIGSKSTQTAS